MLNPLVWSGKAEHWAISQVEMTLEEAAFDALDACQIEAYQWASNTSPGLSELNVG